MVGDGDLDPFDVGWVDIRTYSHGEVGGVLAKRFLGRPVVRASADLDEGRVEYVGLERFYIRGFRYDKL